MPLYFFQNETTDTDKHAMVLLTGADTSAKYNGPEGPAVLVENNKNISMCYSPKANVTLEASDSVPVSLEGQFVIEIDGEIVPYTFNARDLVKYFSHNDPHNTGICFEVGKKNTIDPKTIRDEIIGSRQGVLFRTAYQEVGSTSGFMQYAFIAAGGEKEFKEIPGMVQGPFNDYNMMAMSQNGDFIALAAIDTTNKPVVNFDSTDPIPLTDLPVFNLSSLTLSKVAKKVYISEYVDASLNVGGQVHLVSFTAQGGGLNPTPTYATIATPNFNNYVLQNFDNAGLILGSGRHVSGDPTTDTWGAWAIDLDQNAITVSGDHIGEVNFESASMGQFVQVATDEFLFVADTSAYLFKYDPNAKTFISTKLQEDFEGTNVLILDGVTDGKSNIIVYNENDNKFVTMEYVTRNGQFEPTGTPIDAPESFVTWSMVSVAGNNLVINITDRTTSPISITATVMKVHPVNSTLTTEYTL